MAAKTEKGLKQEIVNLFPVRLRQILEALPLDFARLEEIRLRCGQPILFRIAGKEMGITGSGDLTVYSLISIDQIGIFSCIDK